MVIGEAPGHREDESGKAFVGDAGQELERGLTSVGLERKDLYITNAVHCRPPDNRKPRNSEIDACKYWIKKEIEAVKPKFVLLLGGVALRSVLGLDGITAYQGRPIRRDGVTYLPAYHPAYVLRMPGKRGAFRASLATFAVMLGKTFVTDHSEKPPEVAFKWRMARTREDHETAFQDIKGASVISFDCEATCPGGSGLEWYQPNWRLYQMQIGTANNTWVFHENWSDLESVISRLTPLVHHKILVGHFSKYDCLAIRRTSGKVWRVSFDTGLASHACDENSFHGLKELSSSILSVPPYDLNDKEKQNPDDPERTGLYGAKDAYYTRKLYFHFKKKLAEDGLVKALFHRLTMQAARMLVDVEWNGVYVNPERLEDAHDYWTERRQTALDQLDKLFPTKRTYKVKKTKEARQGYNWGSPDQVAEVLFDRAKLTPLENTPGGKRSVNESVLLRLKASHSAPGLILEWREADKQLNTFVDVWRGKRVNDRLHPSVKLHGTVTGRPSCENPNLYQVPRDPRVRSLIDAPDGWVFVEGDYSQIELRVIAHVAQCMAMKLAFQTGKDIHVKTCNDIMGIGKPTPEERKKAKAINFGFIYGMWWRKFIMYARDNYGVTVDEPEARRTRKGFFREYHEILDYHERQKKFARRNGYVRNLMGRKRRLPELLDAPLGFEALTPQQREMERQAINSPIQGFASDQDIAAAIEIWETFSWDVVRIVGFVYDSILFWIRKDKVETILPRLKAIMEGPRLVQEMGIDFSVPIVVEFKIGPWGKGVEIHDAKPETIHSALQTLRKNAT